MRVLVTGSCGLLGQDLVDEIGARGEVALPFPRAQLDVTDPVRCVEAVGEAEPDVVIHCAAYTDVDAAETEETLAMEVNRDGAENMALAARAVGCLFVFPSTDYVFDGRSSLPYGEAARPNPVNAYGRSKLAGEEVIRAVAGSHLVVRTSWLYGRGGRNFVDTIRSLARRKPEVEVVADQRSRPTWGRSLSRTILDLVEAGATGTIHACDSGTASWYELAESVLALEGLQTRLKPIPTTAWKSAASRPLYSVLNLDKVERLLNRTLPPWEDSLRSYLGESA